MRSRPYASYVILIICVIVNILIQLSGFQNLSEAAILLGAYYKPFILAGEWWRLLTVGFVHVSLIHLFVNSMALLSLGSILEKHMGVKKYLLILLASVIGGSVFLFAAEGNILGMGLSGGLYGLMAAYTYLIIRAGGWKDLRIRSALIRTYSINLMINFLPNIAVTAHLGGFMTGLLLTALLFSGEKDRYRKHFLYAGIIYCFFLGVFFSRNMYIPYDQEYYLSDIRVLTREKELGLETYAYKMAEKLDKIYVDENRITEALKTEE